ncbi:MFS transporter [Sinomicrobium sp. M5D2P17]
MSFDTALSAGQRNSKLQIAGFVSFTFFGYLCIGLPLAVLPIFIHKTLGFSEIVAGVVISLQYVTTLIVRAISGKVVDTKGPKIAVVVSMIGFLLSGILMYVAFESQESRMLTLILLAVTRLITGCAEGMIGASPVNWAMLVAGDRHTATAISYNGIASYGALALGAPLGVLIDEHWGLSYIAICLLIVPALGLLYALTKKAVVGRFKAKPISFFKVFRLVAPFGICLGLAGLGFGGLSNFITLYYDYFNWPNAVLCLSVFSVLFILGRLFFANQINSKGGLKVAFVCLVTEMIGLTILFLATHPNVALAGAAITGLGFSLVFPALGVEAVRLAPASNAGAALACYGLFIDISLGVTGPLEGAVIKVFGMEYLFLFCALTILVSVVMVWKLIKKKGKYRI